MQPAPEAPLLTQYEPIVVWCAAGLFGLFLLIALPALLGDRWRRRRHLGPRCPKCWYSMQGVEGLRCPECGRTAQSPAHLLRSRRRWGWFAVALVPLAIAGVCAFARIRGLDRTVAAVVPDSVILAEAHKCGWYSPKAPWSKFCVRVLEQRYGWDWPAHIRRQALTLEGVTIVPASLQARAKWPSGSRVRVLAGAQTAGSTLRSLSSTRVLADFDEATLDLLPLGMPGRADITRPILIDLGALPDGSYTLGFTLTLVDGTGQPLISSPSSLKLDVGGEVGKTLTTRTDPLVQSWLESTLRSGLKVDRRIGLLAVMLKEQVIGEVPPLSVRIERDGQVIARGSSALYFPATLGTSYRPDPPPTVALTGDMPALAAVDLKANTWTVVFEPDIDAMLAEPARQTYPAFSIRLPMPAK